MRILLHDGGAMLGSFGIGVFDALQSEYGIDHDFFDWQGGTSCGGWNAAYIRTGQFREGINMYAEHLTTGFIRGRVIPFNDMAFLESVARYSPDALCVKTLKSQGQKVFVSLSDTVSLGSKIVCLNDEEDPIVPLLAGSFIPRLSRPRISERYCDGGLTCQPPIAIANMLGQGEGDEVWLISGHPLKHRVRSLNYKVASWVLGFGNVGHRRLIGNAAILENATRDEVERRVRSGSIHFICPTEPLPIHWRSKDKAAVMATVELGRVAARKFMLTYR